MWIGVAGSLVRMEGPPKDLQLSTNGPVLTITLNRPEVRNALRTSLLKELADVLIEAFKDEETRCVVLTGGLEVFAAGADLSELDEQRTNKALRDERWKCWQTFREFPKPLIAAVNGYCLGGGNELAMMCDIVVAGEGARFGQTEINVGLVPGAGGTQRLTACMGKAKAMRYILGGELITAQEAFRVGLVSEVVADDRTLTRAQALAMGIAEKSPMAVRLAKEQVRKAAEGRLDFEQERLAFVKALESEDSKEGVAAFLEKRKPQFVGK
jgi:enoyl-CoA hydratase